MELDSLKNSSDDNDKYIAKFIEEGLEKTIFEVWLNKYGVRAEDLYIQSYKLLYFFGL
ncbi:MAG: hypothetical protein HN576_10415 [Bacteriovoracaceae bacterium]|nr:hypothetical protein [Bacteriovoracaceae bacterium]